jgi:DNA oxidative demethylase
MFAAAPIALAPDVWLLKNYANAATLLPCIDAVAEQAPFRHMTVPRGQVMKVALTNCGDYGWTSDTRGYRYAAHDPISGLPWPAMPAPFFELGQAAAAACGFAGFMPDACLVNRYAPSAGMGAHQDRDEKDFTQPIVSVSLGAACTFFWGGLNRSDKTQSVKLENGDVMVWGGAARLVYHGVRPLPAGSAVRHNITLRRAM